MPGPISTLNLAASPGAWQLRRAAPRSELAGAVVEYWEVEGALDAFRETLLPNGCVELMINLGPPHRLLSEQGAQIWNDAWFSGLQERGLVIESLSGTHLVAARLHPIGAWTLLGPAVGIHANEVVDLPTVLDPAARSLISAVRAASSTGARFSVIEDYLTAAAERAAPVPDVVRDACTRIERTHGTERISDVATALGVSRKHLAVTFERFVGLSAKRYANIHRFVWALSQLRELESVAWTTLAHDAGYSDQSHLVRDFRRVGAASPTEYLRRRTPDSSALLYDAQQESVP